MKCIRKELPEVEVIERIEGQGGVVRYINEFGSECIMLTKHFDELYEKKKEEGL